MIRTRLVLLGLMAVFAIGAVASAPAYAMPEFKPSTAQAFTGTQTGKGLLENSKSEKVECTGGGSPGQIVNATLVGQVVVKFTGCSSSGLACETSGASAKEIRTRTLKGELGETIKGTTTVAVEALEPESGSVEATFTCGGLVPITVKGGVVCEVKPTGKLSLKGELICKGSKGTQEFTGYLGSENGIVTVKELIEERNNATLKSSETATAVITYTKEVEVT
jgi:hypothetical protein